MASKRALCTATRRDGQPCQAPALPGEVLCWGHSPTVAAQRQAARQTGGHHTAAAVRLGKLVPPRLVPIFEELVEALGEVHRGPLPAGRALAMAALARAAVAVLQAGEVEQRLRDLEARERGA
ncbi:MAG TPA: hypothetical protein VII06_43165 [Chloroflexota bacterium]|jgi:ADP-ribose pyrophosphatase YjhB (NUDIX family)